MIKRKSVRSSKNNKVSRKTPEARPPKRKGKAVTAEDQFWSLIESARRARSFSTALTAALKKLSAAEIIGFENIFRRKLADAYVFPLLAANFVIESYVSDDVLEDFRAWLISQGRQRFQAALSDPESICDWLDRKDVDTVDMAGESMLFIAQNAYKQYGDGDEFYARTDYPRQPPLKQRWPNSKADFRKRYPRLVDKFWNQSRIGEYHPV
jgi:hypothetical protein